MSYLTLDIGTHAVRAAIISRGGSVEFVEKRTIDLVRRDDQRVEQDPEQIIEAVLAVIDAVIAKAPEKPSAMGVAIQRSTVLAWDTFTGQALSPALSWQDTRGQAIVEGLESHAFDIQERSGLVLSPHYGASKMRLLLAGLGDGRIYQEERLAISPLVSYVLWYLLEDRPYLCDESNAGRTQLWHVRQRCWDQTLCSLFQMEVALLPEVKPVCNDYGRLNKYGIPISAVAGDQNAALNAVLVSPADNTVLVNVGSGAFALAYVKESRRSASPLLLGMGHSTSLRTFPIVEGTINGAGTALSWFAKQPEMAKLGGEAFLFQHLETWLKAMENQDPPLFVNAVGNVGSPYWRTDLSPRWTRKNLSLEAGAVAIVESIVFLIMANIEHLGTLRTELENCVVSGGVAQSDGFCQRLSSLSGMTLYRLQELDSTLYGAARLASGFLMPAMSRNLSQVFHPKSDQYEKLHGRYRAFCKLLSSRPLGENWVAHRGYAQAYPENTLAAMEEALKCGAHAVEFDVQFSRDNQPVLVHDDTLGRTSEDNLKVSDLTVAELQKISVHEPARFGLRHYPSPVSTVEALVELALQWPGRLFFLEIKKEVFERLSRDVVWLILEPIITPIRDRVVLISFDEDWVRMICARDWRCGWVLTSYDEVARQTLQQLPVDFAICNIKKIQRANIGLWQGPWVWFVYDIKDELTLNYCRQHGIRWLETWDIKRMMSLS